MKKSLKCLLQLTFIIAIHTSVITTSYFENSVHCSIFQLQSCELQKPLLFTLFDSSKLSNYDLREFQTFISYLDEEFTYVRQNPILVPFLVKIDCAYSPEECSYFAPDQLPFIFLLEREKKAYKYTGDLAIIKVKSFVFSHDPQTSTYSVKHPLFGFGFGLSNSKGSILSSFKFAQQSKTEFDENQIDGVTDYGGKESDNSINAKQEKEIFVEDKKPEEINKKQQQEEQKQGQKKEQDGIDWFVRIVSEFLLQIGIPQFLVDIFTGILYIILILLWIVLQLAG